jgi:nucleoside-diphosphate-sugar epimerase
MHIFLTGATGFVGKHLLYYILKDTDFTITIPVRQKKLPSKERFQKEFVEAPLFKGLDVSRVTCIDRDISNIVQEDLSGSCFIHCAAVVKFNQPLEELIKHNYKSVQGLYELASQASMKFIYISTCYTHPKGSKGESVQIPPDLPRESFICDYAYTKYLAEQWLYKQSSVDIIRLSCVGAPLDDLPPMRGPAHLGILEVGYRKSMPDIWFPDNFQFSVVPVDVVCKNLIDVIKTKADGIRIKQFAAHGTYNISALELAKPILKENNITYWNVEFKTFTLIMTALYFWIPNTLQKILDTNYIISTVSSNITFESSIQIPESSDYLDRTRDYVRRFVEESPKAPTWKDFVYQLFLILKKWLVKMIYG